MTIERRIWATVLPVMLLAGCPASSSTDSQRPAVGVPAPSALSRGMVERTNAERRRARLAALREDSRLARAARIHADQIARAGRLAHELSGARYPKLQDRLDAVDYEWRTIGENVASGQPDAAAVVGDWMRSRGHRENILNPSFTEFGVAHAADRAGRTYYVQVFASPR
jgi:uncharacterized protein YkwD